MESAKSFAIKKQYFYTLQDGKLRKANILKQALT